MPPIMIILAIPLYDIVISMFHRIMYLDRLCLLALLVTLILKGRGLIMEGCVLLAVSNVTRDISCMSCIVNGGSHYGSHASELLF